THYGKHIFMLHADRRRVDDRIIMKISGYITYEQFPEVLRVESFETLMASGCHSHFIAVVTVCLLYSLCSAAGTDDQNVPPLFSKTSCEFIHISRNIRIIPFENTILHRHGINGADLFCTVIHLIQKFHYALFMGDCHIKSIE